jgi:hypothetical protein
MIPFKYIADLQETATIFREMSQVFTVQRFSYVCFPLVDRSMLGHIELMGVNINIELGWQTGLT